MAGSIMQYVLYLAVLVVLAIPLGTYMKKVMYGEKTIFSSIFTPCERIVCKVLHVQESEDMTWKQYLSSVFLFSGIGFVFLFLLQLLQGAAAGQAQKNTGKEERNTLFHGILLIIMMLIKDSLPQFRAAGKRKGILHLQCGEFSARI